MGRSIVCAALMLGLVACGPKHATPSGGGDGEGGGSGAGTSGGGAGTGDGTGGGTAKPAPLSRAECEQMIDHVLEIGMAQQRAQKSEDYVPTKEQVAQIRERLVAEQLSACLAWPRPQWMCVMASATIETLYTCAEAEPAP